MESLHQIFHLSWKMKKIEIFCANFDKFKTEFRLPQESTSHDMWCRPICAILHFHQVALYSWHHQAEEIKSAFISHLCLLSIILYYDQYLSCHIYLKICIIFHHDDPWLVASLSDRYKNLSSTKKNWPPSKLPLSWRSHKSQCQLK